MEIISVFLASLSVGSFLNVCIRRIPSGEGIVIASSHCPGCGGELKAADLVPVVSFLLLRGSCRFCGCRIPFKYPAVELAAGFLGVLLFVKYGAGLAFLKYAMLAALLIVIGMIDLETGEVHTSTIEFGIVAGGIFAALSTGQRIDCIAGAFAGFALISAVAYAGGMGWGDADICMMCGLFLGLKYTVVMILLSFVLGGAAGVVLIVMRSKGLKDSMPFGPFLAASAFAAILFGENILKMYAKLVL
ncbi:MAG TPA: prepilin peptidase [Clostridiaceae bacterium]|nr:prepilin peptidase [Clostridiaceae bacterium]